MRSYRDVARRLAALEAQVLDVRLLTDEELERLTADTPSAVRAVIERLSDAELEQLAGMSDRAAEAFIERKLREGEL